MLQAIMSRTVDIYIALVTGFVTGIPCTVLGLLLDRWLKGRPADERGQSGAVGQGLTITQAVQVRVDIQVILRGTGTGGNFVWWVVVLTACVAYLFLRQQIFFTAMILTFALVGLWTGVVLHSLYRMYWRGLGWWLYMIGMLVFAVSIVPIIFAAQTPQYAPPYFAQWQEAVENYGISGLTSTGYLNMRSATWLVSHVAGVGFMFFAIRDAALSMIFYAAVSGRNQGNAANGLPLWAARHAVKSFMGLVGLVAMLVLAYYAVDGAVFIFVTQKFPVLVNELITYVMYGSRGLPR